MVIKLVTSRSFSFLNLLIWGGNLGRMWKLFLLDVDFKQQINKDLEKSFLTK